MTFTLRNGAHRPLTVSIPEEVNTDAFVSRSVKEHVKLGLGRRLVFKRIPCVGVFGSRRGALVADVSKWWAMVRLMNSLRKCNGADFI